MSMEERLLRTSADIKSPLIVAVACFAGDIAAPSELVSALPADWGPAIIFAEQPSAAGHASQLAEALMKITTLPVMRADDGCLVEYRSIYLVPRNVALKVTCGRIHAIPGTKDIDCLADSLFISLAQESGGKAIGVILSGGGSDRALGIRAIRQAGGTTFAQHPGSARFPNLPISAIDTGCVDFVLRPNEIAHGLTHISRHDGKSPRGLPALTKSWS